MLVPAIALVLDALSMEVELASTLSGMSARRQRGLRLRARVASRRGQGRWARMWAGGCAQRSGMSVRAARALCIALHNHALCADRAKLGPKGSDRKYGMSRARNAKSVFVHHFLYLIVVRSRSKKGPLP